MTATSTYEWYFGTNWKRKFDLDHPSKQTKEWRSLYILKLPNAWTHKILTWQNIQILNRWDSKNNRCTIWWFFVLFFYYKMLHMMVGKTLQLITSLTTVQLLSWGIAQLVEHLPLTLKVPGSNLSQARRKIKSGLHVIAPLSRVVCSKLGLYDACSCCICATLC